MADTQDTKTNKESKQEAKDISHLQEFFDAGVHFGHIKSAVHPKMFPYIFSTINNTHFINIEKTSEKLEEALTFLRECKEQNKKILFVGTKFPVRESVQKSAQETGMFFITTYWPGGFLTNWNTVRDGIEHFKKLEDLQKSPEWEKYTKQERALMSRDLEKLRSRWEGVRDMGGLPDAMVLVDVHGDAIAAQEARKKGIPLVAIVDTNSNPDVVDYPIPANDDALSSVSLILSKIVGALK